MKFNPFAQLQNMLKDNRGYTLLFSVIVSVLVLSVAAFILSISRKQFILSSAARDSMYAFYAADTGLECAVEQLNSTAGPSQTSPISTTSIYRSAIGAQGITISCGGASIGTAPAPGSPAVLPLAPSPSVSAATTTWQMSLQGTSNAPCAVVEAWYSSSNPDGTGATKFYIDARGYNIGWDPTAKACNLYGPRRVERAIRYVVNF